MLQEYYTKNFELPGKFTALNGSIQYFTLELDAKLFVEPVAETATDDEKAKNAAEIAAAQANFLRALEILRSRGAQPVITSVEESKLHFTLEQTWVYGDNRKAQVSDHDLVTEAEEVIAGLFDGIKFFEVKEIPAEEEGEAKTYEVVEAKEAVTATATVEMTAGSLVSNDSHPVDAEEGEGE